MNFVKKLKNKLRNIKRYNKITKSIKKYQKSNTVSINDIVKMYCMLNIDGYGNLITIKNAQICPEAKVNINITGIHNKIDIQDGLEVQGCLNINIYGDNCHVVIGKDMFVGREVNITLGQNHHFQGKISCCHLIIGKNVRMEEVNITSYNSNNTINIGDNSLFSLKVNLYNTDGHPIYQKSSGKLINYVKNMIIGKGCWIGYNATILKNVCLAEGTIVGWGSVVTKTFNKPYCAIAGNPARIIKEDLDFKRGGI